MRILVLTKRQYMGKDLLDDRFGRFRELPLELSRLGHQVQGVCLSYRRREEGYFEDVCADNECRTIWLSLNATKYLLPRFIHYFRQTRELVRDFRPDLIWTGSDAYHAIFGLSLAKRSGAKCVIDLYDNFEAFTATRVPGVLPAFRRAVKQADGVSCFSERLADYVASTYPVSAPVATIENGVRKDLFYPRERIECRNRFGLPETATIIGTAGALHSSRGIDILFSAFERLATTDQNLHLAIAGPHQRGLKIPEGPRVHNFSLLPHERVPEFLGCLDVAVICYRHSAQGEYSLPQKAYEIMACGIPLVAAAVGSMNDLLSNQQQCLYKADSVKDLATAIKQQLTERRITELAIPSWHHAGELLDNFLIHVAQQTMGPS